MKRSSDSNIRPYIPKRLRKITSEEPTSLITPTSILNSTSEDPTSLSIPEATSKYNKTQSVNITTSRKNKVPKAELDRKKEHTNVVNSLCWNPHKTSILITASLDKSLIIWNTSGNKLSILRQIKLHSEGVKDVKCCGTDLLTASLDQSCKLINVETGMYCIYIYSF